MREDKAWGAQYAGVMKSELSRDLSASPYWALGLKMGTTMPSSILILNTHRHTCSESNIYTCLWTCAPLSVHVYMYYTMRMYNTHLVQWTCPYPEHIESSSTLHTQEHIHRHIYLHVCMYWLIHANILSSHIHTLQVYIESTHTKHTYRLLGEKSNATDAWVLGSGPNSVTH